MSSTTLQLNISERVAAVSILNDFKGALDKLAVVLEDIKQFRIEESEWVKSDRKVEQVGTDTQWTWNDEKGGFKEITVQSETATYLKDTINRRSEAGEFTVADRAVITLNQKLTA